MLPIVHCPPLVIFPNPQAREDVGDVEEYFPITQSPLPNPPVQNNKK